MTPNCLFFRLLRIGLKTESIGNGQLTKDNVLSTSDYQLSIQQGVGAFIFDGLQKATEVGALPPDAVSREIKMKLFAHTMQVEKHCKSQYLLSAELASNFAKNGIRTVVLKGIAAGICYPSPWHRPCGDLDCFLMGEYVRGNEIASAIGGEVREDFYKHSHINYKGLEVENHQFCTPIRGSKKTKDFERLLQSILLEDGTTKIGETQLENPSPLFNALFLTYHAQRHFLSEGIALRHLCDWAMLIHRQGAQIDWLKFKHYSVKFGLSRFAEAMTNLSARYLNVSAPDSYPIEKNENNELFLMDCILNYKAHSYANVWKVRYESVMSVFKSRQRYKLFSDTTAFMEVLRQTYGFVFDRQPRL